MTKFIEPTLEYSPVQKLASEKHEAILDCFIKSIENVLMRL